MNTQERVCSLEPARQLTSLGIDHESLFYWKPAKGKHVCTHANDPKHVHDYRFTLTGASDVDSTHTANVAYKNALLAKQLLYRAYLPHEFLLMLPATYEGHRLTIYRDKMGWSVAYGEHVASSPQLSNALATMVTYLVRERGVKISWYNIHPFTHYLLHMNEYTERSRFHLTIAIILGTVTGVVLLIAVGGLAIRDALRAKQPTTDTTPVTATSTVDTGFTEQEFVVYSHGTSTVKETVKLPNAGYPQSALEAYLQQRWAFHAAKEPVCTFVRDGRFLKDDRIASFDLLKEKVCVYDEKKLVWEPLN